MVGRKPIGKKAMTPAERQRRRRARLRKEKAKLQKEAQLAAKRAKNEAKYAAHCARMEPVRAAEREEWLRTHPPSPPLPDPLDELAQQVLDALRVDDYSLEAFQSALLRRASIS